MGIQNVSLFVRYPARSLVRGAQRTVLAIFCVAVGVLAIVALQLVGNLVNNALTSDVRGVTGGDVAVNATVAPLSPGQLSFFDQLQRQGIISAYTAASAQQTHTIVTTPSSGVAAYFTLRAVDPTSFPLTGAPTFTLPAQGTLSATLRDQQVVVTSDLFNQLHAHLHQSFALAAADGRRLTCAIAGVIASVGFFATPQMLIASGAYAKLPSSFGLPFSVNEVYADTPGHTTASASAAQKALTRRFPLATVTTIRDAQRQAQAQAQQIQTFLQVVGLLALLIGGIGIGNTIQVLLRRRRAEIAVLKTVGYRQWRLYLLFGVEAGALGLLGGVLGALAGAAASIGVRSLVERALGLHLLYALDPLPIVAGVGIGCATALIFGLTPIAQASQLRPVSLLRAAAGASDEGGTVGRQGGVTRLALGALLAALFAALAASVIGNVIVAIGIVVTTGLVLLVVGSVCLAIVALLARFPVPDRATLLYAGAATLAVCLSLVGIFVAPAFGTLLLVAALGSFSLIFAPRLWRANVRLALRNLGRQRGRSVTTLVALFIGVFAVGVIFILGQDVRANINTALDAQLRYNTYLSVGASDHTTVDRLVARLSGVQARTVNTVARVTPLTVNGQPIGRLVTGNSAATAGLYNPLTDLSGIQGYALAQGMTPQITLARGEHDGTLGRNLTPGDMGSNRVVLPVDLSQAPLNLRLGDQISLIGRQKSPGSQKAPIGHSPASALVTVQVVGFYTRDVSANGAYFLGGAIYADASVVMTASGGSPIYLYALKLNPKRAAQQLGELQAAAPTIQTFSIGDLSSFINGLLDNLLIALTAVASLTLLAGVIIIANTVALAMLERRRELAILKSVGYSNRAVLAGVLIEGGLFGFTGSFLAMAVVALTVAGLDHFVFKAGFGASVPAVVGIVATTTLVCVLVTLLVSWRAIQIRPLEVLRYE